MEEQRSLVVAPIVELSVPIEQVMEGWKRYLKLCEELLDENDYQWAEGKRFRKKSAFRKLARAFNVADEVVDREIERDHDGRVVEAGIYARATAPNGRSAVGYGSCSIWERAHEEDRTDDNGNIICKGPCNGRKHFSKPDHTIPATAHTRAKNRAIADLIGAGEVSAEEMALDDDAEETAGKPSGGTMRFPFGKHKGKLLADIPTDYLEWAAEKAEQEGVRAAVKAELSLRAAPPPTEEVITVEAQVSPAPPPESTPTVAGEYDAAGARERVAEKRAAKKNQVEMKAAMEAEEDEEYANAVRKTLPKAKVSTTTKMDTEKLDLEFEAFLKEELGLAGEELASILKTWNGAPKTRERLDQAKGLLRQPPVVKQVRPTQDMYNQPEPEEEQ